MAIPLTDQSIQQPWLARPDWRAGQIRDQAKPQLIIAWLLVLPVTIVAVIILFVIPGELQQGNQKILLALVFPLAALILWFRAIRTTMLWKKHGASVFEMTSIPGVIGGRLTGQIHLKVKVRPEHGYNLRLGCANWIITRRGKKRTVRSEVLWEDERTVHEDLAASDPGASTIPVSLRIPAQCLPTDATKPASTINWTLTIQSLDPAVPYSAEFVVPVFKTTESVMDDDAPVA